MEFSMNTKYIFIIPLKGAIVVVQSLSRTRLFVTDPMDCSTPGFPILHHLPEFAKRVSIESVIPYNHFILYCPLLLLPSIFPSIRVFPNESALWRQEL